MCIGYFRNVMATLYVLYTISAKVHQKSFFDFIDRWRRLFHKECTLSLETVKATPNRVINTKRNTANEAHKRPPRAVQVFRSTRFNSKTPMRLLENRPRARPFAKSQYLAVFGRRLSFTSRADASYDNTNDDTYTRGHRRNCSRSDDRCCLFVSLFSNANVVKRVPAQCPGRRATRLNGTPAVYENVLQYLFIYLKA